MQKQTINGKVYGVKYIHRHKNQEYHTYGHIIYSIATAYADALKRFQVKKSIYFPETFITGVTICELWDGDTLESVGYAFCSSKDQFNKKKGRQIALNRAIYEAELESK